MMGWYGSGGLDVGTWIGAAVGMVVFWGLIILVMALVRAWSRHRSQRMRPPIPPASGTYAPLEYLDDRFARGEMDPQQYVRMRETLIGR